MTISKKLLFVSLIATATSLSCAAYLENFDITLINPYITKAQAHFASIGWRYGGSFMGQIVKDDEFYKKLYEEKKAVLKNILKTLKEDAQSVETHHKGLSATALQTYQAFKYIVYKPWKRTGFLVGEQKDDRYILE